MDSIKKISELLAERGYGHRPTRSNPGKRDVFLLATGETVGTFSALEAVRFLEAGGSRCTCSPGTVHMDGPCAP